ncbi:MAG: hypothetical protein IPK12_13775 [Gemmatimonadetes bacterium]|nr:hypothetical protein [Gemmatimonadota bacterium]
MVEPRRHLGQGVAPAAQGRRHGLAVERHVFGRHPPHRRLDDRVRDGRLHLGHDRVPGRPLQLGQEGAVQLPAVPCEPQHVRVLGTEINELRQPDPSEAEEQAVVADHGEIAVARDGLPAVGERVAEAGPRPLVPVPVPVADEDVHQARREERPGIHPVVRALLHAGEELVALDHLGCAAPAGPDAGLEHAD